MRKAGVLLHISALPSPYGIGTFGKAAYQFVDFLKESKQSYWQILPLGQTSHGDSPYQTFSSFAGNAYFIDLDMLVGEGLLDFSDISLEFDNTGSVDYFLQYSNRFNILKKAFANFNRKSKDFLNFLKQEKDWLAEYSLFMTLKNHHNGNSWQNWEEPYKRRDKNALKVFKKKNEEKILFEQFIQYKFFEQWSALKTYANKRGIEIIGDMPIYLSLDSADVWVSPEMFELDNELKPIRVAGVPPDGFGEFGQLWGNPLYRWDVMKKDKYRWWVKRVKAASNLFDLIRIDHFIGFDHYCVIPASATDAKIFEWIPGPGYDLFKTIKQALGNVSIIAEDLGDTNDSVKALLKQCGFPGMKNAQFAFFEEEYGELPCEFEKNIVVYTGTHDNQTTMGWAKGLVEKDRLFVARYTRATADNDKSLTAGLIAAVHQCPAETAIIPLQDYLFLGDEARFNSPSTLGGNWKWRVLEDQLHPMLSEYIKKMTLTYKRAELPKKESVSSESESD